MKKSPLGCSASVFGPSKSVDLQISLLLQVQRELAFQSELALDGKSFSKVRLRNRGSFVPVVDIASRIHQAKVLAPFTRSDLLVTDRRWHVPAAWTPITSAFKP